VLAVTVHTTGINPEGILANVASITIILGAFGALLLRQLKRSIQDTVTEIIGSQVTPSLEQIKAELKRHDTRIARLEGIEEGKRQAVAQAGVTVSSSP
jgi:hypothetical protein